MIHYILGLTTTIILHSLFKDKNKYKKGGKIIGGNSGYVGYSMSERAEMAYNEGKLPYSKLPSWAKKIVDSGIVDTDEWHHTSKYGNKTKFYSAQNFLKLLDESYLKTLDFYDPEFHDIKNIPKDVVKKIVEKSKDIKREKDPKIKKNIYYKEKIENIKAELKEKLSNILKNGKKFTRVENMPDNSIIIETEMYGKYGWFPASSKYRLKEYYTGYELKSDDYIEYNNLLNKLGKINTNYFDENIDYHYLYSTLIINDFNISVFDILDIKKILDKNKQELDENIINSIIKNIYTIVDLIKTLKSKIIKKHEDYFDTFEFKKYLTKDEMNELIKRHEYISSLKDTTSSYERKLMHEELDNKYIGISYDRYKKQLDEFLEKNKSLLDEEIKKETEEKERIEKSIIDIVLNSK